MYGGEADSGVSASELNETRTLQRFIKYTSSVYKSSGSHICMGCTKFGDVRAEITGKIQIAHLPSGYFPSR